MSPSEWGIMSGSQAVVECLRRAHVSRVFSIPSGEATDLFAQFAASSIDLVVVTQEHSAAHMADAHARVSGELSACLLRPGPGLTNALGGIAEARMDSSPMVVLVAGANLPRADLTPRDERMAALDSLAGAQPLCKAVISVDSPEEVPSALSQAIRLARQGEPGPVLLEIPAHVQRAQGRMEGTGFHRPPMLFAAESVRRLELAVELLRGAKAVGIYAGAGCFSAIEELTELAERLDAPVASTVTGLGVLPAIHPLSVGFGAGRAGSPLAEKALSGCDLVLAVGCKIREGARPVLGLPPHQRVVHIDLEPGADTPLTLKIPTGAKQALRLLLERVDGQKHPEVRALIRDGKLALKKAISARAPWPDAVDPVKIFDLISQMFWGEDVLVLDTGRQAAFGVASFPVQAPRTLIAPVDYRALGFSVPAAVAAKLANPRRQVVACVGEGGFLLTGLEILTARRCNINPIVALFVEKLALAARPPEHRLVSREIDVHLTPINYEGLAKALDVGYVRVLRDSELAEGLRRALTMETPVLMEIRVDYREGGPFLKAAQRLDWQQLPFPLALRLGARVIQRQILR